MDLADLGQATSHSARHLICDLTSPLAVGSEPRYRLGPPGTVRPSTNCLYEYQWTVRRRDDGRLIWQTVTTVPELRITAAAPGEYLLEVVVFADGTSTGISLSLDHDVEIEPGPLNVGLRESSPAVAEAMRELVTDFCPYIFDAAAATGPFGITARFLASMLVIEILGRPKAGRESDLYEAGALLDSLDRGERVLFPSRAIDRPLGVGQIRLMTAAMVTGSTPWIDEDVLDRRPARDQIKANYDALPLGTKRAIYTRLRWPKSSIALAAKLLVALKNRSTRYRTLTRAQFAANPGAVELVAAEYASDRIGTPAGDGRPAGYGSWVWQQMQEPLMQRFFPDD